MAISNRFSRRIVVDGLAYRWRVPHRPDYYDAGELTALVWLEGADGGGFLQLVARGGMRPDNYRGQPGVVLTPGTVAAAVRRAVADGWNPLLGGGHTVELVPVEPAG